MNKKLALEEKFKFKCVLLGASGAGKSSIVLRYISDRFDPYSTPTIGAAFNCKKIVTDHGLVTMEVWDTAGQERFESLIPLYYKKADIVIIVFDTTNQETYKKAQAWVKRIKHELEYSPIFILIGNKIDLEGRSIATETAKSYANSVEATYIECSAKTGANVENAFIIGCNHAIQKILTNKRKDVRIDISDETSGTINLESPGSAWSVSSCFGSLIYYPMYMFRGKKTEPNDTEV
ncbi:GTP-binding protein ypt5 [Yasminevirus sp. GU-2018]|uniref:GTP-binding protein ypt5 n=1 Tax=Yasminevirus sp. GU-2018 TaxID=2420051 RepID=A0A5K0U8F2_9VIRU|nr:GTP-binding protein ypt5 [Yasminevirus sp. GU-2018]